MLNPVLYESLRKRFGVVKIAGENDPMHIQSYYELATNKLVEKIVDPGEHYRVCCPYCGDQRFRLYINYRWNTVLPDKSIFGKHLVKCFNEECDVRNLEEELQPYIYGRSPLPATAVVQAKQYVDFPEVKFPGTCVPLKDLPMSHPAMHYLIYDRKFDPYKLYEDWNLHFCVDAPDDGTDDALIPGTEIHARLVRDRIMIPIYRNKIMVGWQARTINPHEKKIKYYTMPGFRKNHLVYNGDRAKTFDFGVVVEGVTDVWRVGPRAVCLFGKTMSTYQRDLLQLYWGSKGGMCIMLDADALENMERIFRMLSNVNFKLGAFPVHLPDDYDPADLSTESVWSLIVSYARARGIQLTTV